MNNVSLSERMKDYFTRQINWLDELVIGFDSLEIDLAANDLRRLMDKQAENAKKTQDLELEFSALWKEWEASYGSIPESEREDIAAMARRAEELSLRLASLSENAVNRVEEELTEVKDAILFARRSRENMRRYSQDSGPDPGFMDKKA
ncbi:MAG: hypothetical protein HZB26_15810 [Candidatus Hydrogenedentes bacterium]|nr:hypothetical protein [Candidatus Hydrogenedentota bacterium]